MQVRALPAPLTWPRLTVNGIALAFLVTFAFYMIPKTLGIPGVSDAESYWRLDLDNLYAVKAGTGGAFLYSPVVAQLLAPLTLLPLWVFFTLIFAANVGALIYLLTPVGAALALFIPFVGEELSEGNIHLLLAAALVAGVRHPAWWAVFPLTKVTPSLIIGWHSRWYVALGVAAAVSLVSFVIAPDLWFAWAERLANSAASPLDRPTLWTAWPLSVRLILAAIIVALARWRNRPAALPFAALLSIPIPWLGSLCLLLAVPRLLVVAQDRQQDLGRRGEGVVHQPVTLRGG